MSRAELTAAERLIAEQAVALQREVMAAMQAAPWGQGLAETAAAWATRKLPARTAWVAFAGIRPAEECAPQLAARARQLRLDPQTTPIPVSPASIRNWGNSS